jgi:DNA-binding PadR family transcriptional regulator
MLLGITSLSLNHMGGQQRSSYANLIFHLRITPRWRALRYNELKTAILNLLTTEGWCDSNRIIERARSESGLSASSRAVRMALLRYHRHGLLHREWRRGEYVYRLSDRGARRLVWLRGLTTDELAGSVESMTHSGLNGPNPSQ